jgi:hypothetical protein
MNDNKVMTPEDDVAQQLSMTSNNNINPKTTEQIGNHSVILSPLSGSPFL